MATRWRKLQGVVVEGHQVASGRSEQTPYPKGSIELQLPHFQRCGIDLQGVFLGTINISIKPYVFKFIQAEYTFHHVKWIQDFPSEDFSFSRCIVLFHEYTYNGWIYYPHPETKSRDFQDESILEILAPFIPQVAYGVELTLQVNEEEIRIT